MLNSRNHKRLDRIEVELTPKEWAIRLADEIRRYPRCWDFLRTLAKGTYRESPWVKAFIALVKQAEDRHPGRKPENTRARQELSRKLRTEWHALNTLILEIHVELLNKIEMSRLKIAVLKNQLHALSLCDTIASTRNMITFFIEHCKAADSDKKTRQLVLKTLAKGARMAGSRERLISLCQELADDADILLMDTLARKGAVQAVQERYLDGHAMLSLDVEEMLEATIQEILKIIDLFNEYVNWRRVLAVTSEEGTSVRIDVEAIRGRASILINSVVKQWVKEAQNKAIADHLTDTDEYRNFVWERFREHFRAKPVSTMEGSPPVANPTGG